MSTPKNFDSIFLRLVQKLLRNLARRLFHDNAASFPASPWDAPVDRVDGERVRCNICCWVGDRFLGPAHCEGASCPICGSIGRDRFLFHCFISRNEADVRYKVLETSPRLGAVIVGKCHAGLIILPATMTMELTKGR